MKGLFVGLMLFFYSLVTGGAIAYAVEPVSSAPVIEASIDGAITTRNVVPALLFFAKLKMVPPESLPSAVVVHINSPGGEYEAGFELSPSH